MQLVFTLKDDRGRDIRVIVTFESTGRKTRWLAQFSGTTHATGELSGTSADDRAVRRAVQTALLQAGVMAKGISLG